MVGSLNGDIKLAFSKITAINAKHGPFDLVLCPGDFFGSRDDADAAEKALLSGEIKGRSRGTATFPIKSSCVDAFSHSAIANVHNLRSESASIGSYRSHR